MVFLNIEHIKASETEIESYLLKNAFTLIENLKRSKHQFTILQTQVQIKNVDTYSPN